MKIAIVGTASTSLHLADNLDKDWLIYSCNGASEHIKRYDLHFELHSIKYLRQIDNPPPESYFDMLKNGGKKIMLNAAYDDFPLCQVYPIEEVVEYFDTKYFNNTISYMIAYALYKHPTMTELALIGVDMAGDGEYAHQRPCCEFYLGYARARGVQIHIPDVCPLVKSSHLYGFESLPAYVVSSRQKRKQLEQELILAAENKRNADAHFNYKNGCLEMLKTIDRIYS